MKRLLLALCLMMPLHATAQAPVEYKILADVPLALRVQNWPDANGSGSCVNASTIVCLNWAGLEATAAWWPWEGGETLSACTQHLEISRVNYAVAEGGGEDAIALLQWAARNRIPAMIPFKPRHFCTLVDFDNNGYCVVLDNNHIQGFEVYTTEQFLSIWQQCGGYVAVIVESPPPPWPE